MIWCNGFLIESNVKNDITTKTIIFFLQFVTLKRCVIYCNLFEDPYGIELLM